MKCKISGFDPKHNRLAINIYKKEYEYEYN